jgi:hypothetical protein
MEEARMNQYGAMARRHWTRWLPSRVQAMTDPDSFFSTLGDEVAAEIETLTLNLAGDDPAGEDYLAKLGRLRMARLQAEERVLGERVLLAPEPGLDEEPEPAETGQPPTAGQEWVPLTEDPKHRWWQQAEREEDRRS